MILQCRYIFCAKPSQPEFFKWDLTAWLALIPRLPSVMVCRAGQTISKLSWFPKKLSLFGIARCCYRVCHQVITLGCGSLGGICTLFVLVLAGNLQTWHVKGMVLELNSRSKLQNPTVCESIPHGMYQAVIGSFSGKHEKIQWWENLNVSCFWTNSTEEAL